MKIDEIKALAANAHADRHTFDLTVASMLSNNGPNSRNAAWTLTHLPPADIPLLSAYRNEIAQLSITTTDTSLRRLALSLLESLDWTPDDINPSLLDFCLAHLADPSEPYGVRSLCIKLAYLQCRHYPELSSELRQSLTLLPLSTLSPGVRHSVLKTLQLLPSPDARS